VPRVSIAVNLDVVLARRKMRLGELAQAVGITPTNLSILKTGKARAIRFSTLDAICRHLECQPGDVLEYRAEEPRGQGRPAPGASALPRRGT
jgi:putative transcriptional regulator